MIAKERAESIGVTPSGHLAFLGDLPGQRFPSIAGDVAAFANDIHTISRIDADERELAGKLKGEGNINAIDCDASAIAEARSGSVAALQLEWPASFDRMFAQRI